MKDERQEKAELKEKDEAEDREETTPPIQVHVEGSDTNATHNQDHEEPSGRHGRRRAYFQGEDQQVKQNDHRNSRPGMMGQPKRHGEWSEAKEERIQGEIEQQHRAPLRQVGRIVSRVERPLRRIHDDGKQEGGDEASDANAPPELPGDACCPHWSSTAGRVPGHHKAPEEEGSPEQDQEKHREGAAAILPNNQARDAGYNGKKSRHSCASHDIQAHQSLHGAEYGGIGVIFDF
jgi:hypothetical protein